MQKRLKLVKRKAKPAKPPTEYENARKRRDFTIFLVEDDEGIRNNVVSIVEEMKYPIEGYMTAMEFYRDFKEPRPGVLMVDLRLPGMGGAELQEKLISEGADIPITLIAGHADIPEAVGCLKQGAFDVICKPVQADDVIAAASRAYHYYYEIEQDLDEELNAIEESISRLTGRERQVLDFVADGLSSREIATELDVSTKTVEAHRARINDKMRVDDIAHLIRMCLMHNEVNAPA